MSDLRTAAQQLLGALDKSLYMNDYCGLEVSKHDQPDVTDAIENLRAALTELVQEPMPTRDEDEAQVLARLSKTPAEAYERGYMDGHSRGVEVERERCARSDLKCCQPVQEPVAWALHTGTKQGIKWNRRVEHGTPLYTAPPQRKPLTEEEIFKIENDIPDDVISDRDWTIWFARAVERAAAAAERNAILQMSRDQWFKTQADFEEAIRAREGR